MTPSLLPIFSHAGPSIANHLWQWTVFVAAIGLLALLFGKNRARVRYRLWLAASAKFLIPFSALIALGSVIPISNHAVPVWQPSLVSAVHVVNQPFSAGAVTQDANPQGFLQLIEVWLPAALVLIWALGFAAVLLAWYARWRHVSNVLQRAVPVEDRHEVEILCRIENATKARTRTRFLISSELMEPGIFGIFHPVLLWPAHLSDRLEDAHLEAILAHEVAHVHRRDNLTALIHMVVEAIFWFHPFVWWIERRMLEERERACDEAVVQLVGQADIYADSLLKVSRFCAEIPLPCVSGITGADLSKRIRSIMSHRFTDLGIGKRLMLSALVLSVVAGPLAFGLMQEASLTQIDTAEASIPPFSVISIRPVKVSSDTDPTYVRFLDDGIVLNGTTAEYLLIEGIGLNFERSQSLPEWAKSDRYDISAKVEDADVPKWKASFLTQRKLVFQELLTSRFGLKFHHDKKERLAYGLVIAKNGPKLHTAGPLDQAARTTGMRGKIVVHGGGISLLVKLLSDQVAVPYPIVDETGLTGLYDFTLHWTPENAPESDSSAPSLFTALEKQLGLKLKSEKGTIDVLVVDHIERPSPN